jgi:hypothetical protein
MSFRLEVAPIVEAPVRLVFSDAGRPRTASFVLLGKRLAENELRDELNVEGRTVGEFLQRQVTGWRDQALVIDDTTGKPADFGSEALACLLSLPGAAQVCLEAYVKALGVEGKRGN